MFQYNILPAGPQGEVPVHLGRWEKWGLRFSIYHFRIVFIKAYSSGEMILVKFKKRIYTNENQNFITFRNHWGQPRKASNLWLLRITEWHLALIYLKGLQKSNSGPILKPAKCGLLKLLSTLQLW